MEHNLRHRIIWRLFRPLAMLVVWIRFRYPGAAIRLPRPSIVVANHVTDWDPILMGCSFRDQMYFVSSEHILRMGFVSGLLNWLVAPIGRQKGGSAAGAVKGILRAVKSGCNVAFYPEGNRTWDGHTAAFPPSTGKLVRAAGCSLVTFRFEGSYFASPRWSGNSARRGHMTGKVVRVYTPEELRAMSPAEINRHIAEDIREDAYARQAEAHIRYRGKALAEHLESLLFICPVCGAQHRLRSSGNLLRCTACGAEAEYTGEGFLQGNFGYDRIDLWSGWQDRQLKQLCAGNGPEPLFSDENCILYAIESGRARTELGTGTAVLYRDRLVLPADVTLSLKQITGMSLRGCTDLYIGLSDGTSYQLRGTPDVCVHKYLSACILLGCPVEYGV